MFEEQPAAIVRRRDVVDDHLRAVLGKESGKVQLASFQIAANLVISTSRQLAQGRADTRDTVVRELLPSETDG